MSYGQISHLLITARELLERQDVSPEEKSLHKTAKQRLDQALYLIRSMHHRRNISMRFPNGIPRIETGEADAETPNDTGS